MQTIEILVGLVMISVVALSLSFWVAAIARVAGGRTVIDHDPRGQVPWGLADLALTVLLLIGGQAFALWLLNVNWGIQIGGDPAARLASDQAAIVFAAALAEVAAVGLALAAIHWRYQVSAANLGLQRHRWSADIRLGLKAFVMLAVPVFAIQALLVQWFPSEHPLIEFVKQHPDALFFAVTGFSAVIVAPIAEEYMFRVLLQGWLEKVATYRGDRSHLLVGGLDEATYQPTKPSRAEHAPDQANEQTASNTPTDVSNPDASPQSEFEAFAPAKNQQPSREAIVPPVHWPILISAALFALMHYSHGPDWVALFFLGLGLGYLYQRTHRILPCIIVHMLLNATSLAVLLIDIYFVRR